MIPTPASSLFLQRLFFLILHSKFRKKTADFLNRMAKLGMPMVGVDPALVLCYRDEYKLALGEERGEFNVLLANEWLASALESQPVATVSGESWYFFGHCTEVTALPGAPAQWAAIFARFGRETGKCQRGLLRHGRDLRT